MDPVTILAAIATTVKIGNALVQTGQDAAPAIEALSELFSGDTVTPDQLATLAAKNDAMSAELQAPLPPAQPGDADYVAPSKTAT